MESQLCQNILTGLGILIAQGIKIWRVGTWVAHLAIVLDHKTLKRDRSVCRHPPPFSPSTATLLTQLHYTTLNTDQDSHALPALALISAGGILLRWLPRVGLVQYGCKKSGNRLLVDEVFTDLCSVSKTVLNPIPTSTLSFPWLTAFETYLALGLCIHIFWI